MGYIWVYNHFVLTLTLDHSAMFNILSLCCQEEIVSYIIKANVTNNIWRALIKSLLTWREKKSPIYLAHSPTSDTRVSILGSYKNCLVAHFQKLTIKTSIKK